MSHPTHTHRVGGGKFKEIAQHQGAGAELEGKWLVLYRDLEKGIDSITSLHEWECNWREIKPDDCSVCMGTGHDHIKGNKDRPCGHCYGLGRVRKDGSTPADMWELSEVAQRIIIALENDVNEMSEALALPGVRDLIEQQRQQVVIDSMARQEQEWRDSRGHGPGGQRMTGD